VFGSQQDNFFALDAKTGRELWRVATSGRIVAAPITFLYDGQPMVTIAAGHHPSPSASKTLGRNGNKLDRKRRKKRHE